MRDLNIAFIERDRYVTATTVNHARFEAEVTHDGQCVNITSAISHSYYRQDDIDDLIRILIRTKEFMKSIADRYVEPTEDDDDRG